MNNATKIRTISHVMELGCIAVAVLILGFQLYFLTVLRINPDLVLPVIQDKGSALAMSDAANAAFVFAALLNMLPSLMLCFGLWHLGRMFKLFKEGSYFSDQSVSHLLLFALSGLINQLLASHLVSLAGTVARIGSDSNFINISVTVDQRGLVQLLAWGTFVAVAWIMREGMRIAKENAEFV